MTSPNFDRLNAGYYNQALKSIANPGGFSGAGALRANWSAFLVDYCAVAGEVASSATTAQAAAASALNAPGTSATSASNLLIGAGAKAFVLAQLGKAFSVGQTVVAASAANPNNQMVGQITAFNAGTGALNVNVTNVGGAGTFADWVISLSALGGVPASRAINTSGILAGGATLGADLNLTVPAAVAADVRFGNDTTKAVTSAALAGAAAFITLTDAPTVAWVATSGFNAQVTILGSRIIGAPTGLIDGVVYTLFITQGAGAPWAPSWVAIWDWGASGPPVMSGVAGKVDRVTAQYNAATGKLHASFGKAA